MNEPHWTGGEPVTVQHEGAWVLGWQFGVRGDWRYVFWAAAPGEPTHGWVLASRVRSDPGRTLPTAVLLAHRRTP